MIFVSIIGGFILLSALYGIILYNRFIRQNNQCEEAWSSINVQLKRRYDLIPNLIACVKGYTEHEKGTLEKLVDLRNLSMTAKSLPEKSKAENELTNTFKSLFALSENYPDLKANQNFIQFQSTLAEIEDNIQNARRYYNATVRDFNTSVGSFPSNIIAGSYGFTSKEYFETGEDEKQNIQVSF